jgi:hypothetical protein
MSRKIMEEEKQSRLEEIDMRLSNLQVVIQVAQNEIEFLLLEKENLTKRNPIGFRLSKKKNGTK